MHTIERKFYKQELRAILTKQTEFIPEYGAQNEAYICGNAPRGLEPL